MQAAFRLRVVALAPNNKGSKKGNERGSSRSRALWARRRPRASERIAVAVLDGDEPAADWASRFRLFPLTVDCSSLPCPRTAQWPEHHRRKEHCAKKILQGQRSTVRTQGTRNLHNNLLTQRITINHGLRTTVMIIYPGSYYCHRPRLCYIMCWLD